MYRNHDPCLDMLVLACGCCSPISVLLATPHALLIAHPLPTAFLISFLQKPNPGCLASCLLGWPWPPGAACGSGRGDAAPAMRRPAATGARMPTCRLPLLARSLCAWPARFFIAQHLAVDWLSFDDSSLVLILY